MRMVGFPTLIPACIAAAAATASTSASAYDAEFRTDNIHNGNADNGAVIDIRTDILHNTCNIWQSDWVQHEMIHNVDSSMYWYIEVGFMDGLNEARFWAWDPPCVNDVDFWADSRNGGGYNIHYPNNGWNWGQTYELGVVASGQCAWDVYLGGVYLGTSTSNCPGQGRILEAGLYSDTQSTGSAKGFLSNWWELSGGNTWRQAWDGGYISWTGQPFIQWQNNYTGTEEVLNEPY